MSERRDEDLLRDILEAAQRIHAYTKGTDYKDFARDLKTQDAVIRNLEIVGEAAKGISDGLRDAYPDLPWRGMAGLRDRLIHQYFGVNLDIVWQVAHADLPEAASAITPILEGLSED